MARREKSRLRIESRLFRLKNDFSQQIERCWGESDGNGGSRARTKVEETGMTRLASDSLSFL